MPVNTGAGVPLAKGASGVEERILVVPNNGINARIRFIHILTSLQKSSHNIPLLLDGRWRIAVIQGFQRWPVESLGPEDNLMLSY